jgi:integrase
MSKRRANNEGSLFQRKDGRWVAEMMVKGERVTQYFKTQKEGRAWLKQTLAQIDDGLNFFGARTTLDEYLAEWIKTIEMTVRPKTCIQYAQIIRTHISPTLGKVPLKDLRPDMIQNLYNARIKAGVSQRTTLLVHAVLHKALGHALRLGLLPRNPAAAVSRPRFVRPEMHTWDETQVRTFLLACQDSRYAVLYQMAISTGLRQGELLGLKWSDLDWATRRLHIQRQLQRLPQKGLVFCEPKSKAGRRVIVLGKSTIDLLRRQMETQQIERQFAGDDWQEFGLIFASTIGTPTELRNLFREFKSIAAAAGLPEIRFHDLRHTAATLMLSQNIHPKVVQERLGHSDISLTLNTYSHVLPGMQEEAADKIDDLLTLTPVQLGAGRGRVDR